LARIALFTSTYAPEPIGSAVYMADFAQELVRRGHEANVICAYPYYPAWEKTHRKWRYTTTIEEGVRVIRVPHTIPTHPTALARAGLEATYGLASAGALARLPAFDAAIGAVPALSGALGAWFASRVRRKPYGLMVRDLVSAAAMHGNVPGSGPWVAKPVRAVEAFVTPRAARVAVIARGFEAPVRELGAKHVDFLPNYRTVGEPGLPREAARAHFGIPQDVFAAVYSGAMGFKQGILNLVEAAAAAPEAFILVAGDGSQRAAFEHAVATSGLTNVRWRPLVPDEEYADLLNAADAFLMPQGETEVDMSVPGKLTSYLAIGRPIIVSASPHSETARIVVEASAGVIVPPADGAAIGWALRDLAAAPAQVEAYTAGAARYAAAHLDRTVGLDRFVEWALALAERRDPRFDRDSERAGA